MRITSESSHSTAEFYAALWIGALLVAGGAAVDAFPDDLDELAAQFFHAVPADRQGVARRGTCVRRPMWAAANKLMAAAFTANAVGCRPIVNHRPIALRRLWLTSCSTLRAKENPHAD